LWDEAREIALQGRAAANAINDAVGALPSDTPPAAPTAALISIIFLAQLAQPVQTET